MLLCILCSVQHDFTGAMSHSATPPFPSAKAYQDYKMAPAWLQLACPTGPAAHLLAIALRMHTPEWCPPQADGHRCRAMCPVSPVPSLP
jgi:hypothetical protein